MAFRSASDAWSNLPSGVALTAFVDLINPKNVGVEYTLSWSGPGALFSTLPPLHPTPVDANHVSWDFTLAPGAEHLELTFTLEMAVPSAGKTYTPRSVTVLCDTLPHDAENLVVAFTTAEHALAAFTLPEGAADDDLTSVVVRYQDVQNPASPGPLLTTTLPVNDSSLTTVPSPDPLGGVSSSLKRYFQPSVTAGHAYHFQITLVDAVGQSSGTVSGGVDGVEYELSYDANLGTGSLPAAQTYAFGDTAVLDDGDGLTRTGYRFAGWNTAADGSGMAFAQGESLDMTLGDLLLFAQWIELFDVEVTVGWSPLDTLTLTPSSVTLDAGETLSLSPSFSGGAGWRWFVDGVRQTAFNDLAVFTYSSVAGGFHTLSVTVDKGGVRYSADLPVTVRDGVMVTYLANGAVTGSAPSDPTVYGVGHSVTILGNTGAMARPGFTFTEWNTEAGGTGDPLSAGDSLAIPSTGLTLYAQWEANP